MNNRYWFVGAVLLALAGSVGCSSGASPDVASSTAEMKVVRFTDRDVAALGAQAMLRVDLTARNTVYVVQFEDTAALARVEVTDASGTHSLASQIDQSSLEKGTGNQFVLAGDPALAQRYAGMLQGEEPMASTNFGDVGQTQQSLIAICDECHVHSGGVIHCTGCVIIR